VMTRYLGTWGNPSLFGAFNLVSVAVIAGLYIWKGFLGGENPALRGNPFDGGDVLTFPARATQSGSLGFELFAPGHLPLGPGLGSPGCPCPSKEPS